MTGRVGHAEERKQHFSVVGLTLGADHIGSPGRTRPGLPFTFGDLMPRICQRASCDKALPSDAATQRKFCSTRCQVAEWRRRKAEKDAKRAAGK